MLNVKHTPSSVQIGENNLEQLYCTPIQVQSHAIDEIEGAI